MDINEEAVNRWFEKITSNLSDAQRTDLKRKFAKKGSIYGAANRIELIAWDIATHFNENVKKLGLGLKGQVATDSKLDAIRYKKALDETGLVTSAVIISAPDTREGNSEVDEDTLPEVQKWWKQTMAVHGNDPEIYEKQMVSDFGSDGAPDLLIVVDKLLTGFDEPRNTVLYIDKPLKGHNLIQAVARVNRLHDAKRYGVLVDYRGILKELDTANLMPKHGFVGINVSPHAWSNSWEAVVKIRLVIVHVRWQSFNMETMSIGVTFSTCHEPRRGRMTWSKS